MVAYITFTGIDDYPVVTDRMIYLATYDDGWSSELIADLGDGPLHFPGAAIASATRVYLAAPDESEVHQIYQYEKSGESWTPTQLTDAETNQLRPIIPTDARSDLPVVWDYGTWTAADDWSMGLAGLVRGTPSSLAGSASGWPSFKP